VRNLPIHKVKHFLKSIKLKWIGDKYTRTFFASVSFKATIAIFVNIIVVAALVLRIASADENSVRFNVHYFSIYTEPSPASSVTATLSCDRLFAEDDTILRLRANGIIDNVKPDFAPLERDFTIRRIVFGHRDWLTPQGLTARTEWTIQLRPLKTGEFTLPALNIGPMVTEPLRLTVQNKQQTDIATLTEHVRVEVETVPKHPYVNGQILYTVRMLFDEWLVDGNLSSPVFEKAYSRKLNKHYSYDTERDGHRYKVSEYRYIVFPEHSGHFVIPGPTFSGAIAYRGYAEHEDTKCTSPLEFTTEPTVISVLPPPSGYNESDWLPSEQLTLTVTPPVQTSPLKFGEPLVRNIVITAKGLSAAAIPDLPLSQLDNAQIYPGRRQAETQLTDDGLVSVIEQTITILPVRTGILTLPAISLAWWDTLHQRKQISSFPAQTISIVPVTQTKQIRAVVDKESVFESLRYWGPVYIFLFTGLTTGLIYKGLVRYATGITKIYKIGHSQNRHKKKPA
jgi:hypothetical protein